MTKKYWNDGSDPYLYENSLVLINIPDIKDQKKLDHFEHNITEANMVEVKRYAKDKAINFQLWKDIHKIMFRNVYEWAG